ncbi:uncharacterized protein LOC131651467 [Vicia villosa]|uniref:uncharacterized protein LOC131651467 n=1 Tax=Vicia villosa TaxID=3911 RepID=UPI00273B715D|nr:uncharacterized protein LOC131651467 [Vicia villosa]
MYVVWKKLQRLQHVIRKLSRPYKGITQQIEKAKEHLKVDKTNIINDRMNMHLIERAKACIIEVINIEEQLHKQKSKVEWLRLGDGNNAYFHASLKSKRKKNNIRNIMNEIGTMLFDQKEIEEEVRKLYSNLVGTATTNLNNIDILEMRSGKQITIKQSDLLTTSIIEEEIFNNLKGISDLSAPRIDAFGSKFFKATWEITNKRS